MYFKYMYNNLYTFESVQCLFGLDRRVFVKQLCDTQDSSDILWRTSGGLCISGVFCWGFGLVASGFFVACVRLLNTMFVFI